MDEGMRILVASPFGKIIAPVLSQAFTRSTVAIALDRANVQRLVTGKYRFDVVVADLVWDNPDPDYPFDGLDVVDMLRDTKRLAPVLLATQGRSLERDHLDEARLRPEVVGVYEKTAGLEALLVAVRAAAAGESETSSTSPAEPHSLYQLFTGQKGTTTARLAGAIAAGRASDGPSLSRAAQVGINTANKVARAYVGPIIQQRGEHDPELKMTSEAVYRWCGLHSRYLISWCRRHGHGDVLRPHQRC